MKQQQQIIVRLFPIQINRLIIQLRCGSTQFVDLSFSTEYGISNLDGVFGPDWLSPLRESFIPEFFRVYHNQINHSPKMSTRLFVVLFTISELNLENAECFFFVPHQIGLFHSFSGCSPPTLSAKSILSLVDRFSFIFGFAAVHFPTRCWSSLHRNPRFTLVALYVSVNYPDISVRGRRVEVLRVARLVDIE